MRKDPFGFREGTLRGIMAMGSLAALVSFLGLAGYTHLFTTEKLSMGQIVGVLTGLTGLTGAAINAYAGLRNARTEEPTEEQSNDDPFRDV